MPFVNIQSLDQEDKQEEFSKKNNKNQAEKDVMRSSSIKQDQVTRVNLIIDSKKEKIKNTHKHVTEKNLLRQTAGKPGISTLGTGKFQKTDTFVDDTVLEETEFSDDESLLTDQMSLVPTLIEQNVKDERLTQKTFLSMNKPER